MVSTIISSKKTGFGLLEVAVVMLIVALVTAATLMMAMAMMESARSVQTARRLNAIETALYAHRLLHHRLPCPGELAACGSDAEAQGEVPVNALHLPEEDLKDGWDRPFAYAVWPPYTQQNAFLDYGIRENCGGITIKKNGTPRSGRAIYRLSTLGELGGRPPEMRFRERWQLQNADDGYRPHGRRDCP